MGHGRCSAFLRRERPHKLHAVGLNTLNCRVEKAGFASLRILVFVTGSSENKDDNDDHSNDHGRPSMMLMMKVVGLVCPITIMATPTMRFDEMGDTWKAEVCHKKN